MEEKEQEKLQSICFSSDLSYVDVGTSEGFRIYSSNPNHPVQEDRFREKGNIKFIQNFSNLVVYVRGGPLSNGRELYFYDDYQFRDCDKMVFRSEITGIRLTKFCLLVILEKKSYLFDLNKVEDVYKMPKKLASFDTCDNPRGIGCLLNGVQRTVVILPGLKNNEVQVFDSESDNLQFFELSSAPYIISGNVAGDVFAYADSTGKFIRFHSLVDGDLLKEFDRGDKVAEISSISFDSHCRRVAVSSNLDTVHVYALPKEWSQNSKEASVKVSLVTDETEAGKLSSNNYLGKSIHNISQGVLSKLWSGKSTEKSYLRVYVQQPYKVCTIVDQTLLIMCSTGKLYSVDVNEEGLFYAETNPKNK